MLSMLLIGMISFTAMANTTAKPERKQTTEFTKEFTTQIVTPVSVETIDFIFSDEAVFTPFEFVHFKEKPSDNYKGFASFLELSWCDNRSNKKLIPYREKLLYNYDLKFKSCLQERINRIRSDC